MEYVIVLAAVLIAAFVALTFLAPRGERLRMWRAIGTTRWVGAEMGRPRRSMTPQVRALYDRPPPGPPLAISDLRTADMVRDVRRIVDAEGRRVGRALDVDGACVTTWLAPDRGSYEVTIHHREGLTSLVHRAEGSRFHVGGASIDHGSVAWWEFDDVEFEARLLRADPHGVARVLLTMPYTRGSRIDLRSVQGHVVLAGEAVVAAVTMRGDGCVFSQSGSGAAVVLGHTYFDGVTRDLVAERQGRRAASVTFSIEGKDGHGELASLDLDRFPAHATLRRRGVSRGSTVAGGVVVGMHVRSRELEGPDGFNLVGAGGFAPQSFECDGEFIAFAANGMRSIDRVETQPVLMHVPSLGLMALSHGSVAGASLRGDYVMWTERDPKSALLADQHDVARGIFVGELDRETHDPRGARET